MSIVYTSKQKVVSYIEQLQANRWTVGTDSLNYPYRQFLKIIKTTGEVVTGRFWGVMELQLCIIKFKENHGDNGEHLIPIDSIESIIQLDESYPPKLALNQAHRFAWEHKRDKNKLLWIVELISHWNSRLVGQFLNGVYQNSYRYQGGYASYVFLIKPDPNDPYDQKHLYIHDIKKVRRLPYTPSTTWFFEPNKKAAIEKTLISHIPKVLIQLVMDYLLNDIPDEIPRACFDFLKTQYAKEKAEQSHGPLVRHRSCFSCISRSC